MQAQAAHPLSLQRVPELRVYNQDVQTQIKKQEALYQGMKRYEELKRQARWERHSLQWREAERFRAEQEYMEALAKLEFAAHQKIESADRVRSPNLGAVSDFIWTCLLTRY